MQRVIGDKVERVVVVCDHCATEVSSKATYDKKRPVPQDIYLPDDFVATDEGEYCAKCAKALTEASAAALRTLRGA